jgi:hypothetical protein
VAESGESEHHPQSATTMEDNGTAFTHLLWLVSRGQALVAELLRLTANVPPVFNSELEPKYADILIDFRYFKVRATQGSEQPCNRLCAPSMGELCAGLEECSGRQAGVRGQPRRGTPSRCLPPHAQQQHTSFPLITSPAHHHAFLHPLSPS